MSALRRYKGGRRTLQSAAIGVALVMSFGCGKKDESKGKDKPAPAKPGKVTPPTKVKPTAANTASGKLDPDTGKHEGTNTWSHVIGGEGRDNGRAVAIDAKGNVAVGGLFSGTVDLGTGTKLTATKADSFVTVYGPDGKLKWAVGFGGPADDIISAMDYDGKGNLLVAGLFGKGIKIGGVLMKSHGADDIFLAKYDPQGKLMWAKTFGGLSTDAPHDIVGHADGSATMTGVYRAEIDFGAGKLMGKGGGDMFLVHFDAAGNQEWAKTFGDFGKDYSRGVAVDPKGAIILVGEFSGKVDFGGGALESTGNRDLVVAKFSPGGDYVWAKKFGNEFNDSGYGLSVDPGGNIVVVGAFEDKLQIGATELASKGEADIFVLRLEPNGGVSWVKSFGADRADQATSVATDKHGNIVFTGEYYNSIDFGGGPLAATGNEKDLFLVELSPKGEHLWSRNAGDKDHDQGRAVAMNGAGTIALTGTFRFSLSFGGKAITGRHKSGQKAPPGDAFVAVFSR